MRVEVRDEGDEKGVFGVHRVTQESLAVGALDVQAARIDPAAGPELQGELVDI